MFNGSKIKLAVSTGLAVAGIGIASLASVSASAANSGSTTGNVGVTQSVTLSGLTSAFTLSGVPAATVTGLSAATMNVKTNDRLGYTLSVQPAAATMSGAIVTNTDTIPVSNLTVKNSLALTYTALNSGAPVTVATTSSKTASGGDTVNNDYQIVIPWVNADTYSVTLNYVASGN